MHCCDDFVLKRKREDLNAIPGRHLVLNFDVNKTIVMSDAATGKSLRDIANHVLASSCWGHVDASGESATWSCTGQMPSTKRLKPELVSYAEFLEQIMPGKDNKERRESLWHRFTAQGQPGEAFQPHCEAFLRELTLPDDIAGTEAAKAAGLSQDAFIIPAFFELMLHLKKTNRLFSLVFRTFGTDLPDVAQEFNAFCEGKHPLFPEAVLDGRDGKPDYRIDFEDCNKFGTLFRSDASAAGTALVLGTLKQPKLSDGLEFYADSGKFPKLRVVSGGIGIVADELCRLSGEPGTLALRDYFPCWREMGMGEASPNGGKLMIVDPRPSSRLLPVFFDDNITYKSTRIVDVRDARRLEKPLWIQYVLPCHVVRAEPLEAVSDRRYFIKHVERLSIAYEARLAAQERLRALLRKAIVANMFKNIPSEPVCKRDYSSWSAIQVPAGDYSLAEGHAEIEPDDYLG